MDLAELFFIVATCAVVVAIILFQFLYFTIKKIHRTDKIILNYEEKYKKIIDVDREIENRKTDFHLQELTLKAKMEAMKNGLEHLQADYQQAYEIYDELIHRNQQLQENPPSTEFVKNNKDQAYREGISLKARILHPLSELVH